MSESVFSAVGEYSRNVWLGMKSLTRSIGAILPYWLQVGAGENRKEITEQYPDPVSSRTADELAPRTRGFIRNDIDRCTGCGDCSDVCPTSCITVETELGPEPSKTWVSVFDVDNSRCIFCGLCVEVCVPTSLTHSKEYEGSVTKLESLVKSFGKGRVTQEQRAKWAAMRRAHDLSGGGLP